MKVERNLLLGTIAAILIGTLLLIIFAVEDTRTTRETDAQQGKLIARGARLYDTYCAGCHGERGEGLPGIYPPLNVEDLWAGREEIAFYGTLHDYVALNISAGHPEERMPSWADEYGGPLRNDQIEDLTQFILNWQGQQPEGVRVEAPETISIPPPDTEAVPEGEPAPEPGKDTARGGQIFAAACARCHGTDASGTDQGPSLVSAEVMAKSDEELERITAEGVPGASMPGWGEILTADDIANLVAYVRSLSEGEAPVVAEAPGEPSEAGVLPSLPSGDAQVGRALFMGATPLENGGPSCLSCHTIAGDPVPGGGTLGSDLTSAYNKHGDLGLAGVLADLGFPVMESIYADRPLTPEEQADLRAFLEAAAAQQPSPPPTGRLGLWALGGFLVLMALAGMVWRRRLRGVRRSLVKRMQSGKGTK